MKKRLTKAINKALACILSIAMLISMSGVVYAADKPSETIYALLDSSGKPREIIGVSGDSSGIAAEEQKGITGELPFNIKLSYLFNNATVIPQDVLGMSGDLKITVDISSNAKAKDYFKENMALQMQFPIDVSKNTNIIAEGLTGVTVGSTKTLSSIVMPASNASFTIAYKTESFELASINFVAMPFDMSSATDIDLSSITEQVKQLQDGISQYTNGVSKIDAGMTKASGGLNELALSGETLVMGYTQLAAGQQELIKSLTAAMPPEALAAIAPQLEALTASQTQLDENLKIYTEGIFAASGGISAATKGLNTAAKQGTVLNESVKAATAPLNSLTVSEDKAKVIPVSFLSDNEVSEIQFVMRTDALKATAVKEDITPTEKPKESFWARLVALFK